jgi:hypothetical protein
MLDRVGSSLLFRQESCCNFEIEGYNPQFGRNDSSFARNPSTRGESELWGHL